MDSERSFTDIITRGCNPAALSDNVPTPNETPACDEALASVKGIQKRSKNFSKEEDELLVSALLNEKNALRMFKSEDKQHRNFPYLYCWEKLKDKAKWKNRSNQSGTTSRKKQKSTAN
ncbi:unnamed protein product [Miscanthus lutarioriparius]|uniref:No apical meristem-associated C-terminal domain-containing protein n=1 Tax=Miscanthus lutarioriparius TaxID=422564 RepID=A0A811SDK8_9POAL|nr:unnamed protein product [Miscanthus lutarioriparius]